MILILSEEKDQTTNDVIDWLLLWKYDFISIKEVTLNQKGYDIIFQVNDSAKVYS